MTDELPPGRELDALIAEKVMGWTECDAAATWTKWQHGDPGDIWIEIEEPWCRGHGKPPGVSKFRPYPRYSEDIAAAWQMVERFLDCDGPYGPQKWSFGLEYSCIVDFVASFDFTPRARHERARDYPAFQAEAGTMPHAICLAALKAVRAGGSSRGV